MSSTTGSGLTRDERGVATYTVDDAPTRNALSTAVLREIDRALATLADDTSVRVVVFTGAGTTFSSGADRSELGDPATIETTTSLLASILHWIEASPVPVLARVNGAAFGAGLAIAAAADISIATSDAVFGLPEVRFGLVAGPAAAACLGRMGQAAGLDLLLTGRRFGAERSGHRAAGSVASLVGLAERFGFPATTVELVRDGDSVTGSRSISATYLRSCVEAGDLTLARFGLGRAHRIGGVVKYGDHRRRTPGFPAANASFDRFPAVPADRVYAGHTVFN
jgi:hypothetical protein